MGIYNDSLSGSDQEYRTWRMTSRVHSRMDSRQTLCAHEWRPSRLAPIGCVYFAHGMGEHAFAYRHLGQQLAAAGFVVLAVDYYGHGLSDGSRLSVGFYDAVKDYLDFVSATALRRHDLPRFMLGQSLGGLLAMHVVLTDQVRKQNTGRDPLDRSARPTRVDSGCVLFPRMHTQTMSGSVVSSAPACGTRDPGSILAWVGYAWREDPPVLKRGHPEVCYHKFGTLSIQ